MFTDFAAEHPVFFGALVWPLVTAFVTGLFGMLGHYNTNGFAGLSPRVAFVLKTLASSGVDAPTVLKLLRSVFAKAGPMLVLLAVASTVSACAFLQSPKGTSTIVFGAGELVCIFEHRTEPPLQIARDCLKETGPSILLEIETLVSAERTAAQHTSGDAGADR